MIKHSRKRACTYACARACLHMMFDRFPLYILLCQIYNGNEKVNGTRAHSVHTYTHMTQHLLIINYTYTTLGTLAILHFYRDLYSAIRQS